MRHSLWVFYYLEYDWLTVPVKKGRRSTNTFLIERDHHTKMLSFFSCFGGTSIAFFRWLTVRAEFTEEAKYLCQNYVIFSKSSNNFVNHWHENSKYILSLHVSGASVATTKGVIWTVIWVMGQNWCPCAAAKSLINSFSTSASLRFHSNHGILPQAQEIRTHLLGQHYQE